MSLSDFFMTFLPPLGAIAAELFDFCSVESLQRDTQNLLEIESWEQDKIRDRDVIRDLIAYSAAGASEVVGVAPTFISVIFSGAALAYSFDAPWIMVVSFVVLGLFIMVIWKLVSGQTYYAIAEKGVDLQIPFGREIRRTRKEIISYMIFSANGVILLLVIFMNVRKIL